MTLRRRIPARSYPPPGMDRARPVDRDCPLLVRRENQWACMVTVDATRLRPLLMGCPSPCGNRDRALLIMSQRAAFEDAP